MALAFQTGSDANVVERCRDAWPSGGAGDDRDYRLEGWAKAEVNASWRGGTTITCAVFRVEIDSTPMLKGLPGDRCCCPYWGHCPEGGLVFTFEDREGVHEAGDAFYAPAGGPSARLRRHRVCAVQPDGRVADRLREDRYRYGEDQVPLGHRRSGCRPGGDGARPGRLTRVDRTYRPIVPCRFGTPARRAERFAAGFSRRTEGCRF
jgi:hypothetical protein